MKKFNTYFRRLRALCLFVSFWMIPTLSHSESYRIDVSASLAELRLNGFLSGFVPVNQPTPSFLSNYSCDSIGEDLDRFVFCEDEFDLLELEAQGVWSGRDNTAWKDSLSASYSVDSTALSSTSSDDFIVPTCKGDAPLCGVLAPQMQWDLGTSGFFASSSTGADSSTVLDTEIALFSHVGYVGSYSSHPNTISLGPYEIFDIGFGGFWAKYDVVSRAAITPIPLPPSHAMLITSLAAILGGRKFKIIRRNWKGSKKGRRRNLSLRQPVSVFDQ